MGEYVMSFMGIITNPKNESYIKKFLKEYINMEYVIFINEKNIINMKNIKFDTILLGRKFEENETLNEIIRKCKYLILNSDLKVYNNKLENLNVQIITYGFNQKATITTSSVSEDKIVVFLQRSIVNMYKQPVEQMEISVDIDKDTETYPVMESIAILLINCKNIKNVY